MADSKMFPSFLANYASNSFVAYAKFLTNCGVVFGTRRHHEFYLGDIVFGKFCHSVFSAPLRGINSPSLFVHVLDIVKIGASKKMLRINARPVIAPMTNVKPFRDFSFVEFVRDAMRPVKNTFTPKLAVTRIVDVAAPNPARNQVASFHVFPETNLQTVVPAPVPVAKLQRLAFYPSLFQAGKCGEICRLTTAAFTQLFHYLSHMVTLRYYSLGVK